jgi:hypothetical protein
VTKFFITCSGSLRPSFTHKAFLCTVQRKASTACRTCLVRKGTKPASVPTGICAPSAVPVTVFESSNHLVAHLQTPVVFSVKLQSYQFSPYFTTTNTKSVTRVAQSVQRLTTDWTDGVRSPTEAEDFSSNLCVQTGSGAHPASCTMGIGGSFPGGKARPGHDADHSPPSSAEVKKE